MDYFSRSRKPAVILIHVILLLLILSGCMKKDVPEKTDTLKEKQNLSAEDLTFNCGDGLCSLTENSYNCVEDCPAVCGNSVCDVGENALRCSSDCIVSCENKPCSFGFKAQTFKAERSSDRSDVISMLGGVGFRFLEFSVSWRDIEPQKGKFELEGIRNFVDKLASNGIMPVILIKTGDLEWAVDGVNKKGENCEDLGELIAPDRESSYAPKSMDEYRNYVRTLVGALDGRVKYWLIENEPAGCTFFVGNESDYYNMLTAAYEEIHTACKDCKVGLSNFAFSRKSGENTKSDKFYLDDILLKGGLESFDFFSEHCNAGRGKRDKEELGLNVNYCDMARLRDDHLEERWMGKEIIMTESGELDDVEIDQRIKRNLYSLFYGNASMVGTLQIDQLLKCTECLKRDENPLDDVQQNWRFLNKLFNGMQTIEYLGVNDGPVEKQYEHFKVTRKDKPAFHVLWKDGGDFQVKLPGISKRVILNKLTSNESKLYTVLLDGGFIRLDPFREPERKTSGGILKISSSPLILEEIHFPESGQTPKQTTTTLKQPEYSGGWQLIGPGSSAFSPSIAIAGGDRYLVINCGGARRSLDGGESWEFANKGFDYGRFGYQADDLQVIAPHPSERDIVFAGGKTGLYRSTDKAASWSKVASVGEGIDAIAFDPSDDNVMYAGEGSLDANEPYFNVRDAEGTVLRSDDNGVNWQIVSRIQVNDEKSKDNIYSLSVSRNGVVYAATNIGLWKSSDQGRTWTKVTGLPHDRTVTVKADRFDPKTVYAVLLTSPENAGGVWKSTDEGNTWKDITSNLPAPEWNFGEDSEKTKKSKTEEKEDGTFGGKEFGKTRNYKDFEQHPRDPDTLYVTSIYRSDGGVYASYDGGGSWRKITTKENIVEGWAENKLKEMTAADLAINEENPLEMAFTSHGETQGFRTTDGGETWQPLHTKKVGVADGKNTYTNIGMESYKGAIAIHPNNSNIILLAYGDHGIFKSVDGGKSFFRADDTASDALNLRFSPADPNKAYMVSWQPNKNLWVSDDAGSSWTNRNQDGQEMLDVAAHPKNEEVALVASYKKGVLKTEDGGETWETVDSLKAGDARSVAFYPTNPEIVYVGADRILYKSRDEGVTWTAAYVFDSKTNINAILILEDEIFLATGNGVYLNTVGKEEGQWTLTLPIKNAAALGGGKNFVYAASEGEGVWMSAQYGASGTWQEITGDWSSDIRHLAADPENPKIVYASGKCAGVWKKKIE